jgi:hypothetical protein
MASRRQTYQGHRNGSAYTGGYAFTYGANWRSNYGMPDSNGPGNTLRPRRYTEPRGYRSTGHAHSAAVRGLYEHRSTPNHSYSSSRGHVYPAALRGLYPHGSFRNHGLSGGHAYPAALGGLYRHGSSRRR